MMVDGKDNFLVILDPMETMLGLKGNSLRIFATIHNYSKDGVHRFVGGPEYFLKFRISVRSTREILKNLELSGYINVFRSGVGRGYTNEYTTNYAELIERAERGEDIRPLPLKRRGQNDAENRKGGESAPFFTTDKKGGESDTERVVKAAEKGGESAPHKDSKGYDKDSFYSSTRAREECPVQEEEKQEFLRIFFVKNAADPAAEVRRFLNHNESLGWENGAGRKYDTPAKRRALANLWQLKTGATRLKAEFGTDEEKKRQAAVNQSFLKFIDALYDYAVENPDPSFNPAALLNPKSRVKLEYTGDGGAYNIGWLDAHDCVVTWVQERSSVVCAIARRCFNNRFMGIAFGRTA